jgi:hypothetical protein
MKSAVIEQGGVPDIPLPLIVDFVVGLSRTRRDQRTANSCRVLWLTLRDTENTTATSNGNGTEKSNVLAFKPRTAAPIQMAA